jgi:hypothetical protein
MKRTSCLLLLVVCLAPANALAWNALGHRTVAEIAWRQLDPATRQSIADLLRRHPRFDKDFASKMDDRSLSGSKADEDHWIFLQAATWPDLIRKEKDYDHPEWHYISIPMYLDQSDEQAVSRTFRPNLATIYKPGTPVEKLNAIQALDFVRGTVQSNAAPEVKAVAVCWLLHLVGDLHQPLHCNELVSANQFPKGDEGGNKIPLVKGKNLHSAWDGLLGRQYYLKDVAKAADELSDKSKYGDIWESAASETDPRKWADESHSLCVSDVYTASMLDSVRQSKSGEKMAPIDLPTSYYQSAGTLARKQVLSAGLRLAALLKSISPPNNHAR